MDLRLCNKMISRCALRGSVLRVISRAYSKETNQTTGSVSSSAPPPPTTNAPGLSSAVVRPTTEPVGPGIKPDKSGPYKSPEYFCYNDMSYYEAEVEMAKYRCPPPNAHRK